MRCWREILRFAQNDMAHGVNCVQHRCAVGDGHGLVIDGESYGHLGYSLGSRMRSQPFKLLPKEVQGAVDGATGHLPQTAQRTRAYYLRQIAQRPRQAALLPRRRRRRLTWDWTSCSCRLDLRLAAPQKVSNFEIWMVISKVLRIACRQLSLRNRIQKY